MRQTASTTPLNNIALTESEDVIIWPSNNHYTIVTLCHFAATRPQLGSAEGRKLMGTQHPIRPAGKSEKTKDMETKATHTFEELKQAAGEQSLRIEQKDGKYRVVRTLSEKFGLVAVKAGAGYSLDYEGLRKFLISNSVDIGGMLTDWSKELGHSHHNQKRIDTEDADLERVH